ncbi:MAG: putative heme-binding domain-containing protein, partial [Bacteroidia bacterium]
KKKIKLILLSPTKNEVAFSSLGKCTTRNNWLGKASVFIKEQATQRGHTFIDLYSELIQDPKQHLFTENGIQLNQAGHEKMSDILLSKLELNVKDNFSITIDEKANVLNTTNCQISNFSTTVYGASFDLSPTQTLFAGKLISKEPVAIYINGQLHSKRQDTISYINLSADSLRQNRLINTIKEKNRLHRYRLRPLNEAYIFLFRRHEMGHLAYEMDDLNKLVEEKEREISKLLFSDTYDIEIELIKPWVSPKDYPEDEVPAIIPEPNIAEEIAAFNIAEGYEISLFASDPMIANPININWDTQGRAWVATSSTYPHIVPGREPNDKIIILEDTNNDGKADKHTVFAENLLIPHSVMPVAGGAYVTATTQLLFLADTDGDDKSDERRSVYDGFGNADVHHMIHGLRWAPWGDLHFTQSIYINSFIDTPYGTRILNGSGTWTFRPENESLEIMSRGLINPWGLAFDQWGQSFATDGAGSSGINYVFPGSAHATAVGVSNVLPGLNSDTPKNTAAEVIYSRHFPKNWQGSIITNDFRANRTVRYSITPEQSGYSSKEVETIIKSNHRSYRPVDCKIGPDGALYIVDWYNPIIDHGEVDFHHPVRDKTHGRIWKVTKKGSPLIPVQNFANKSSEGLLEQLKSPEQYTRLQANRAYVEQKGDPKMVIDWINNLKQSDQNYTHHRLEGLWLLRALNHYDETTILKSLNSNNPQEKAAAVRLLAHWQKQKANLNILDILIEDDNPQVRLETLHALRGIGDIRAAEIAIKALDKSMDQNLEFALNLTISSLQSMWLTGMINGENIFGQDQNKQLYALTTSSDKKVVPLITSLLGNPSIDPILTNKAWLLLANIGDSNAKSKVLVKSVKEGNLELLNAMINAPNANQAQPDNLSLLKSLLTHEQIELRMAGLKLSARWKAVEHIEVTTELMKSSAEVNVKMAAGRALLAMGKLSVITDMAKSAADQNLRTVASAIWIEYSPESAADNAVKLLKELNSPDLAKLIFLTYRRLERGPKILSKALKGQKISKETASIGLNVVQSSGLNLVDLENVIREAGNIKPIDSNLSTADKKQLITDAQESGDSNRGKKIYMRNDLLCASCHRINGNGGLLGPDLTSIGSYMTPNSILESVLNPNSDIKQGYETVLLTKTNGEVVSGLLHRKTNNSTLVRQPTGDIVEIPAAEIAKLDVSPKSLMPSGLTNNLNKNELKDLLAYLISLGVEM